MAIFVIFVVLLSENKYDDDDTFCVIFRNFCAILPKCCTLIRVLSEILLAGLEHYIIMFYVILTRLYGLRYPSLPASF